MKEIYKQYDEKFTKVGLSLANEFKNIRAGRANPGVLDRILVDYYGSPTPIQQMAAISVAEARILVIAPWDATSLKAIEKAINASDLGINPQNDGKTIRLTFPALTEERRRDLAKEISKLGENAKVAARNVRRDAIDAFKAKKKNSEITEDDLKTAEKDLQEMTDKCIKEIDKQVEAKSKEIMEV